MDAPGGDGPATEQRVVQLTMTEEEARILIAIVRLGGTFAMALVAAAEANALAGTTTGVSASAALCRRIELLVAPDPAPGGETPAPPAEGAR